MDRSKIENSLLAVIAEKTGYPSEMLNRFPEIRRVMDECQFNNCPFNHINNPKCAVSVAVDNGSISQSRYNNYVQMLLGMDMEADLGIDSTKRVEIFGVMAAEVKSLLSTAPIITDNPTIEGANPQELAELRTLEQIVDYISGKTGEVRYKLGAILPIVSVILVFLATRAIKKDEDLVRSADRIR
jgi:hypothetical protein